MGMSLGWLCGVLSLSCNATPNLDVIQAAYEREASAGSKLHDKGLQVLEAKCHDKGVPTFYCEVTFTSKADPQEHLYFDIVTVERSSAGWKLASGLCKR